MNLHELKDIVSIYDDRAWDKADITLWDPDSRTMFNLTFTGSIKPGMDEDYPDGRISFNLSKRSLSNHEQDEVSEIESEEEQKEEFFYLSRDRIGLWLSAPDEMEFITDNPRFMKRVKIDNGLVPISSNGQTFEQILNMLRK